MKRTLGAALTLVLMTTLWTAAIAQKNGDKQAVLSTVNAFETAYKQKNRRQMLMVLMAPTQDPVKIQQRYEWLRGHGPGDAPNTAPVLFKSARGSFVPKRYTVSSAKPLDEKTWQVVVNEEGKCYDEDGKYNVQRKRFFKIVKVRTKWMVGDYYLNENPTNYGFPVDDISDKMQKLGN